MQEPKPELPISIDIGRKIWSMCKFDASMNGCRFSSQDCRFIHLDMIDQAVLSDSKKLAKLAVSNWDQAKLNSKYQPSDKDLLNLWANSDSNERNPLFIKYKTMIEEKDPEFAQITQDLKDEEMELKELKNAFYIKKQRYITELSSRLRQKILSPKAGKKPSISYSQNQLRKEQQQLKSQLAQESSIDFTSFLNSSSSRNLQFELSSSNNRISCKLIAQSYQPHHYSHNWNSVYQPLIQDARRAGQTKRLKDFLKSKNLFIYNTNRHTREAFKQNKIIKTQVDFFISSFTPDSILKIETITQDENNRGSDHFPIRIQIDMQMAKARETKKVINKKQLDLLSQKAPKIHTQQPKKPNGSERQNQQHKTQT
ncbi:hypothetical protein ABPG72_010891 [Tetrahymena utriculariae]